LEINLNKYKSIRTELSVMSLHKWPKAY